MDRLLEITGLIKHFAGTRALNKASLRIQAGEVVGLIGENGAGKSTLIKILAGVHSPDAGQILWEGSPVRFRGPYEALQAGIATIHQELAYFEKLTLAENLLMGERWPRRVWGGTDWRALNARASELLHENELDFDPRVPFQTLSSAQRQEMAIARALSRKAKLLILDEPTASLTEPEVERLMRHLARLKQRGVAILYVSHRLEEVLALTGRVIVLRDGGLAAEYPTAEASIERMVRDMVGREVGVLERRSAVQPGPVRLSVQGLGLPPLFAQVSFDLRAGEILGLAGLVGAGRSELARAIYGLYPLQAGAMSLAGQAYLPGSARAARARGIVYLPEERKRQGFVLEHSIQSSVAVGFFERLSRFGWIFGRRERTAVAGAVEKFRIKTRSLQQPIGTLSGGNQQKALLARWLETDPEVIILDEPTRGVDVGAKAEIHRLILNLASQGKAILLISSDLPELLTLSDRVLVLHRGRPVAEFPAAAATQEAILLAASGLPASRGSSAREDQTRN